MIFRINDIKDIAAARSLLVAPGETLADTLAEHGMKQPELAERMGRPLKTINEIINGKAAITPDTARQLERVLGVPGQFWLNAEKNYRADIAELEEKRRLLTEEQECIKWFPIKEIQKRGYIPETQQITETLHHLWRFFRVSSADAFHAFYAEHYLKVNFKKSNKYAESQYALATWLRMGEIEASEQDVPEYDAKKFQSQLEEMKKLVMKQPDDFWKQAVSLCNQAGVYLVYVPSLQKAPASGAAHWLHNNPIIQLSNRYKTNDHFWFALYHEAGHILKHSKKDVFVEGLEEYDGFKAIEEKEAEADDFSSEMLIPKKSFNEYKAISNLNETYIKSLAKRWKTHPAIVVGRLQKFEAIHHSQFNNLKVKISLD
ncbi:MAG: HigA family addiction module antidote protein [Flavobacteriales bacterium]|nr:HigA family addiction module antidote protein [Flavobacteriales bacterium]